MQCLIFVKFLLGGSLPPQELFSRINTRLSYILDGKGSEDARTGEILSEKSPKSAICIADYESIEQLTMDLAIIPGAGISSIEVIPLSDEVELQYLSNNASL